MPKLKISDLKNPSDAITTRAVEIFLNYVTDRHLNPSEPDPYTNVRVKSVTKGGRRVVFTPPGADHPELVLNLRRAIRAALMSIPSAPTVRQVVTPHGIRYHGSKYDPDFRLSGVVAPLPKARRPRIVPIKWRSNPMQYTEDNRVRVLVYTPKGEKWYTYDLPYPGNWSK